MNCLNDYIGLGGCTTVTPNSGLLYDKNGLYGKF